MYLGEDLGATSTMIGISGAISALSALLIAPFAKQMIKWTGEVNMVVIGTVVTNIRMILYAVIMWSPPYHMYILSAIAFMSYPLPWIASIQYGYKIAPPSLIATVISLIGSSEYILGQGIGGFVGGQLVDNAGITLPQLFYISAAFSLAWLGISYVIYKLFCKKHEIALIKAKEEEERTLETEDQVNEDNSTNTEPVDFELRKRKFSDRQSKTKSRLEFEDSIKYWNSQVVGHTKF